MNGRINDIPYNDSPPLKFTYQQAAALSLGTYTFTAGTRQAFTPDRPINPNVLYHFRSLDFMVDVDEIDFTQNVGAWISFSMYLQSEAGSPALREPILLPKYFQNLEHTAFILGSQMLEAAYPGGVANTTTQGFTFNRLLGNLAGTVSQSTALLGKQSLNGIVLLTVQEIVDQEFIGAFMSLGKNRQRGLVPVPHAAGPLHSVF